jgi:CrcB protein
MTAAPAAAHRDPVVLSAIAIGGGLGSLIRYELSRQWPAHPGDIPWTTLAINVSGSLLLGMLVVAVTEIWRPHRLLRPALGTGLLGGYTTFSTFAVESRGLLTGDHAGPTLAYLALSVGGGLLAAALGMTAVRRLERPASLTRPHGIADPFDPDQP